MMEKECILVVNDEEKERNSMSGVIRKYGYEVITAHNGWEALETVKRKDFNLVITSLEMFGMTGIYLLKAVKTIAPGIGVIIVTGYGDVESYIKSMYLGAFEYINKPIKAPELMKIITRFFHHPLIIKHRLLRRLDYQL